MNLKEKLAEEYRPDSTCLEELHLGCLTRDAFLAGFEKAREMAVIECQTHDKNGPCDDLGCVAATLKKLGEEEVENENSRK